MSFINALNYSQAGYYASRPAADTSTTAILRRAKGVGALDAESSSTTVTLSRRAQELATMREADDYRSANALQQSIQTAAVTAQAKQAQKMQNAYQQPDRETIARAQVEMQLRRAYGDEPGTSVAR